MTATAAAVSAATRFPLARNALSALAAHVLDTAKRGGATAAETEVSQAFGLSVTVRKDEVETIAYNRDKGVGVTVYVGTRRGHASTADFSPEAIADTVAKALTIARYTAADDCAGLADPVLLARSWGDLDLYHPWDLSVDDAIAIGRECEAAALATDPRLTNSDGATVSLHEAEFVYANSATTGTPRRARPAISNRLPVSAASPGSAPRAGSAPVNSRRWSARSSTKRRWPPA